MAKKVPDRVANPNYIDAPSSNVIISNLGYLYNFKEILISHT